MRSATDRLMVINTIIIIFNQFAQEACAIKLKSLSVVLTESILKGF